MKPNKEVMERIELYYSGASSVAMEEIERIAREIIADESNDLSGYCQGMGTWFFGDEDGNLFDSNDVDLYPELEEIDTIMQEWDVYLRLTGEPLRLEWLNGEIVRMTDW